MLNRLDNASRTLATLPADDYRRLVGEAAISARKGRRDQALVAMQVIRRRYGDAANYQYAEVYAQLGDVDKSLAALEDAWTKRNSGLASMLGDPFLDSVRNDPRFAKIAGRVFG